MSRCVLVCGGRGFKARWLVFRALDALHAEEPIARLVHGGADGADGLAAQWAMERDVVVSEHKADWRGHGHAAGPIRNQRMLDQEKPDLVVAFRGGRGTLDMVRRAKKAGVPVREEQ